MKKDVSNHLFALYVPGLKEKLLSGEHGAKLVVQEPAIIHRIGTILRLKKGDAVILFDDTLEVPGVVDALEPKKQIIISVESSKEHRPLQPEIHFFLPVLKRDDLDRAVYALTALGVHSIDLIETDKTRSFRGGKELDRLKRIAIAAAEQAKQFVVPKIGGPISFKEVSEQLKLAACPKLFFDPAGDDCFSVVSALRATRPNRLMLLVGPEGDLTAQEKNMLTAADVQLCRLTPTVLRAADACWVGGGIFRSMLW